MPEKSGEEWRGKMEKEMEVCGVGGRRKNR